MNHQLPLVGFQGRWVVFRVESILMIHPLPEVGFRTFEAKLCATDRFGGLFQIRELLRSGLIS